MRVDPADDFSPAWSPDGRTVACIRKLNTGNGELVLIPASGGPEHKVADLTDDEFNESPGRLVSLAWSLDGSAIAASHRRPEDASELTGFAVTSEGIYYEAPPHSGDQRFVRFFSFASGTSRPVAVASQPFSLGLTVSPRQPYILFDQVNELDRDLMLLRNFDPE